MGADLAGWADDCHRNFTEVVKLVDAPVDDDPFTVVPHLQAYVSGLPLDEFDTDDWVTLHTDLVSFLAEFMIRKHSASWATREAPRSPRGFRYVLEVGTGTVDPFEVVAHEFRSRPIEIIRMIASAELTCGL